MKKELRFYVYEHWRPDKDICFYVGKGNGPRAFSLKRTNKHHKAIIAKLAKLGMCAEVRLVCSGLSEKEAFAIEKERIAFWRASGVKLSNRTDGGEGASGTIITAERRESSRQAALRQWADPVHRKNMSEKGKARVFSAETLAKMSAAQKKSYEREELRGPAAARMRAAAAARKGKPGRKLTEAERKNLDQTGKTASDETKAKQSAAKLGKPRKPFTEETIARMRIAATKREAAKKLRMREPT